MRTVTISLLLLVICGCSPFTKKPVTVVNHDNMEVLKGAIIATLIGRGYEIESITDEGITTKERYAGSRNEVKWDIVVRPGPGGATVDTHSVNAEGEVDKHVAEWMADLKAHIERTLQKRTPDDLTAIAQNYAVAKVTVSNALPNTPCSPLGTVSATAPGMTAAQGIESARRMLEIEGVIKSADFVVIETNNMVPMGFTIGYTLTGTAYSCEGAPAEAPPADAPVEEGEAPAPDDGEVPPKES